MQGTVQRLKVLFVYTRNSRRSQMAEGRARRRKGDLIGPHAASIETHGLKPNTGKVMLEACVDISGQRSAHVGELKNIPFDSEQGN